MTCAKQVVKCTLLVGGKRFVGYNACLTPQATCPREPGEGYDKCKSICNQQGHAEEQAVAAMYEAGSVPDAYSRAYLEGHTHYCHNCQHVLCRVGISTLTIGPPPAMQCPSSILSEMG